MWSVIIGVGVSLGFRAVDPTDPSGVTVFNPDTIFLFGLLIIFTILVLLTTIYAIYVKIYIKRYYYDCGDKFITIKKGVFAPTEIHVQYQKIQDVYVDQDILDRIIGLYDVHIASATVTSGIEAHIDGVSYDVSESIKKILLAKIQGTSGLGVQEAPVEIIPHPNSVKFNQKISSETYPMGGAWILFSFVLAIGVSLLFSVFLGVGIWVMRGFIDFNILWTFIIFCSLFFCSFIGCVIWKNNYYFEFLPDHILFRTGLISIQENHLPYKSIQNVLNKQGVLSRILGLSTLVIENAAGWHSVISLVWQPAAKAQELNDILNDVVIKTNPQNQNYNMGL